MKRELLSGDLDSIPQITRALENGLDYRPEWRQLQVQKYLNSIYQPDAEPSTRLDKILAEESDPFVRDLLLFHCGRPCANEECVGYAAKCQRDNCNTLFASAIKALVIANGSPELIAQEFGTTKEKIETFEKLYFDARRYLKHRGWLRGVCFAVAKPNAVVATESRWFAVAFRRGWPGVEEVVLGRVPKTGERTLQGAISVLLGRIDDYYSALEPSGAPPSERDVKTIVALVRAARGLPCLWENPLELEQESSTDQELNELGVAGRERLHYFFTTLIKLAQKKGLV